MNSTDWFIVFLVSIGLTFASCGAILVTSPFQTKAWFAAPVFLLGLTSALVASFAFFATIAAAI